MDIKIYEPDKIRNRSECKERSEGSLTSLLPVDWKEEEEEDGASPFIRQPLIHLILFLVPITRRIHVLSRRKGDKGRKKMDE